MAEFRNFANSLTASEWSTAFAAELYELWMRFFNGFSTSASDGFFKGTTKSSDILLLCAHTTYDYKKKKKIIIKKQQMRRVSKDLRIAKCAMTTNHDFKCELVQLNLQ